MIWLKKLIAVLITILGLTITAHAEGVNPPVAVKTGEGVFLSWMLDECEEYTIYRNGEEIARTNLTNYMDEGADGTGRYKINNTPVEVWEGQFLDIPLNVPKPYSYTYPDIKHVTIKSGEKVMSLGEIWTIVPIEGGLYAFLAPDGTAMDVNDYGTTVGTKIITYSYHGGDNQKFYIEEAEKGYLIKGLQSKLYFALSDDGTVTLAEKKNATVFEMSLCAEEITQEVLDAVNVVVPLPPEYYPGDASVGDLDGDGEWEIVLKWDPSDAKDSSQGGNTGRVFLDAYELDGTHMWRIDMGINIRAGAHDTQFLVYDLDKDGKAEVATRISDGTIDGCGNVIGDGEKDWREGGRNLQGPLWVAVFDGTTGKMLAKCDFDPQNVGRETSNSFGDGYGNRSERYNACVAYVDGETPHMIFQRGYYARTVVAAYKYEKGKITKTWRFDTNDEGLGKYGSNGNHNISVADADNDGKDEIFLGSLTLDDDGSVLWCGFEGHGDAMHLGDFDPDNEGLEFFSVHEAGEFGYTIHDAATGEKIFDIPGAKDTGRGLIINAGPFDGNYIVNVGSGARRINSWGENATVGDYGGNFRIFWDGDLYEEPMNATHIVGYGVDGQLVEYFDDAWPNGYSSINGSKATPCLTADIFGDWREEFICKKVDGTAIRIYTTTIPSEFALPSPMSDHVYRMGVVWQNSSYNQPPHLGYYSSGYGKMKLNSLAANVNGMKYLLPEAPLKAHDEIFVPLEFLCEVSGGRMMHAGEKVYVFFKDNEQLFTVGEDAINFFGTLMVPYNSLDSFLEIKTEFNEATEEISILRNDLDFIRCNTALLENTEEREEECWVRVKRNFVEVNSTNEIMAVVAVYSDNVLKSANVYEHIGKMNYPKPEGDEIKVFTWDNLKPLVNYSKDGSFSERLSIKAYTASSEPEEQNAAVNAIDGNIETCWASFGEQNIVYELTEDCFLEKIRVAFSKYDDNRHIPYEIYISSDNESWSLVKKGNSPVRSNDFVEVVVNSNARYVKIVGKGNTVNGWNRVAEVELYGRREEFQFTQKLDIKACEATSEPEAENLAVNTIDNNPATFWATRWEQDIVYDLGSKQLIDAMRVSFFKYPDNRYIPYEIYISSDKEAWTLVKTGNSLIQSDEFININVDKVARYVKITVKGSTFNGWNRLSEVEIYGTSGGSIS